MTDPALIRDLQSVMPQPEPGTGWRRTILQPGEMLCLVQSYRCLSAEGVAPELASARADELEADAAHGTALCVGTLAFEMVALARFFAAGGTQCLAIGDLRGFMECEARQQFLIGEAMLADPELVGAQLRREMDALRQAGRVH